MTEKITDVKGQNLYYSVGTADTGAVVTTGTTNEGILVGSWTPIVTSGATTDVSMGGVTDRETPVEEIVDAATIVDATANGFTQVQQGNGYRPMWWVGWGLEPADMTPADEEPVKKIAAPILTAAEIEEEVKRKIEGRKVTRSERTI